MTLEQFNQQISDVQKVAASNPEEAITKNKALFIEFAQQDGAFVVLDGALPLSAPAQDGDPRLFLRVFSHEEAAQVFVEKRGGGQVTAIDGVELMQLAKSSFLRGVYGFLLNDGFAWAILPFPDFLQECFRVVFGAENMYNEDYVAIIQLINMVRRNDFYKLRTAQPPDSKGLYILDTAAQESPEFAGHVMEDLSPNELLHTADCLKDSDFCIRIGNTSRTIPAEMLQAALRLTHLGEPFPDDFHVDSISLDFCLEDFATKEPPAKESKKSKKEKRPKRERKAKPPREKKVKQTREKKKLNPKAALTVVTVGFAILAFTALFFGGFFNKKTPLESLKNDIDTQYYSDVAKHYAACKDDGTDGEAQQIMLNDLDAKFQAYVAGDCTAENLKNIIFFYASISYIQGEAEAVYAQAAAVEQSKKAYQDGLDTKSVSSRLECWRKVSMDDPDTYSAMLANLSDHAREYKRIIFVEAASLPESDALSRLILLQSFYPGDPEISAKIRDIQAGVPVSGPAPEQPGETVEPTSLISITSAYVQTNSMWGDDVDLCINWENISGKKIEEVDFEVIPYDSGGNQVTTKKANEDGQYYSRYLARDIGPFDDGYVTPANHRWEDAWVNSSIAGMAIDKVSILFVGEETPSVITDAAAIAALFE